MMKVLFLYILGLIVLASGIRCIKTKQDNNEIKTNPNITIIFPEEFLSPLIKSKRRKLVYLFTEFDCYTCVQSYLARFKILQDNGIDIPVQIIGIGELEKEKYDRLARVKKFTFDFIEIDQNERELLPAVNIPNLFILNERNEIIHEFHPDAAGIDHILKAAVSYFN